MAYDPLAVVIATRNRVETLLTTLDRLLSLPERAPVVVVDNGSDDGTPDRVRQQFPGVKVLELGDNRGAEARNVGVRFAGTPLVAFADDDSWWAPGALARAIDAFVAQPRLGLLAARVLVGPAERLDPVCLKLADGPLDSEPGDPGPAILGFLACGAVVRTRAFEQAGGFPTGFGIGGEEELLAIDLAARGWKRCYVEAVVAHHHPAPARDPVRRREVQVRNALWSAWLRRRAPGALARTAQVLRPVCHDPATRAGLREALAGASHVWRQRRPVSVELERALSRRDHAATASDTRTSGNRQRGPFSAAPASL